jgi:hypothetical protein
MEGKLSYFLNKSNHLICLLAVLLISTTVSAQKTKKTNFLKNLSDSTSKVFKKTFVNFRNNKTSLYAGIGFNRQSIDESGYSSPFNYRLSEINNKVYKPGYQLGVRIDGDFKKKNKYAFMLGLTNINSGLFYKNAKTLNPIVGDFSNFKADNQFFNLSIKANYKKLLSVLDSTKYKFYFVVGPSVDIRLSKQSLDNQINNNYRGFVFGYNVGVEFDNNSYYTLFIHYNHNINSLTKSPVQANMSSLNLGVFVRAKDLF